MTDAWLEGRDDERPSRWHRIRVYFGLADDPRSEGRSVDPVQEDRVLAALASLERRVGENTAAVEALRAELKHDPP